MKVEIRRRTRFLGRPAGQQFYFRIVGTNGEPIAQSEQYVNRDDCLDTAVLIVGDRAEIVDLTDQ